MCKLYIYFYLLEPTSDKKYMKKILIFIVSCPHKNSFCFARTRGKIDTFLNTF